MLEINFSVKRFNKKKFICIKRAYRKIFVIACLWELEINRDFEWEELEIDTLYATSLEKRNMEGEENFMFKSDLWGRLEHLHTHTHYNNVYRWHQNHHHHTLTSRICSTRFVEFLLFLFVRFHVCLFIFKPMRVWVMKSRRWQQEEKKNYKTRIYFTYIR